MENADPGEIVIRVPGPPPAKQFSPLLAPGHRHRARVIALLRETRAQLPGNFVPFQGAVGLEMTLYSPDELPPGDATNFLGGVADVLQRKPLGFELADLVDVVVYENDAQLRRIEFRQEPGARLEYELRLRELSGSPLDVARLPKVRTTRPTAGTVSVDLRVLAQIDDRALEFANAMNNRIVGVRIRDLDQLITWLERADLMTSDIADGLRRTAWAADAEARSVFLSAKSLARCVDDVIAGRAPSQAVADLTSLARACSTVRTVSVDAVGAALSTEPSPSSLVSLLCPILDSLLRLADPRVRARTRACRDTRCGNLFLDRTKNGSRVWCAMNTCGTRAKMRTWRLRNARVEESALPYVVT